MVTAVSPVEINNVILDNISWKNPLLKTACYNEWLKLL